MSDGRCCGYCGGALTLLGRLGRMIWYRCRDCGADLNEEEE